MFKSPSPAKAREQGSILLVVVIVAALVLIMASVAAPIFLRGENQRHSIESKKRLQSAFRLMFPEGQSQTKAKANMWTDFGYEPAPPPSAFYDLKALVERSAVATSDAAHGTVAQFTGTFPAWNGPYWQGSIDALNRPVDAWGRPIRMRNIESGWQVLSLGANGVDDTGNSATPAGDDLVYPDSPYTLPVPPPVVVPPSIYYNLTNGFIGRANIDGTSPNHTFLNTGTTGLSALAVNDTHLYWVETTNKRIRCADRSGANITTVVTLNHADCLGLAVNSTYLYWGYRVELNGQVRAIGRYKLDGTDTNHTWITFGVNGQFTPMGLAINDNYIFWASNLGMNIGRANLDGTSPSNDFCPATGISQVAAASDYIYYTQPLRDEIRRRIIASTTITVNFIAPGFYAEGIAATSTHLYWAYRSAGANAIGRANRDGTGKNINFIALPSDSVGGIAVR